MFFFVEGHGLIDEAEQDNSSNSNSQSHFRDSEPTERSDATDRQCEQVVRLEKASPSKPEENDSTEWQDENTGELRTRGLGPGNKPASNMLSKLIAKKKLNQEEIRRLTLCRSGLFRVPKVSLGCGTQLNRKFSPLTPRHNPVSGSAFQSAAPFSVRGRRHEHREQQTQPSRSEGKRGTHASTSRASSVIVLSLPQRACKSTETQQ